MDTAGVSAEVKKIRAAECDLPIVGLASAVACAAAGSLLGYSLLAKKRRLPVSGQLFLGLVAGCAGAVTWMNRQGEIAAARQLIDQLHEAQDARWLKKHPVAYG